MKHELVCPCGWRREVKKNGSVTVIAQRRRAVCQNTSRSCRFDGVYTYSAAEASERQGCVVQHSTSPEVPNDR